jgi:quercetin dioxygenase-like cupin family protein
MALRRYSRVELLVSFVVLLVLATAWLARAQQPPANEEDNFTGKAFRLESKGYGLSRRGFDAAARSNWHTHDGAQLVFVEEGRMRAQVEGQPMKEVAKGESVFLPGGVAHWHGAVPAQAATQLSVTFAGGIKWMEKVTDAQYAGTAKR